MAIPERHRVTALRTIRRRSGQTQRTVAAALGLSKSTYSAWETGRISLNVEHIMALCDYFECTPNELLRYGEVNEGMHPEGDDASLTEEERQFLQLFSMLAPNNRSSVLDLMLTCTKQRRPRTL